MYDAKLHLMPVTSLQLFPSIAFGFERIRNVVKLLFPLLPPIKCGMTQLGLIPRILWDWYLFGKEYIASNLSMFHFDQTDSQTVVPRMRRTRK